MSLLADLRKEQLTSLHPERHVFRISRTQEREIVRQGQHICDQRDPDEIRLQRLFGCKVDVVN